VYVRLCIFCFNRAGVGYLKKKEQEGENGVCLFVVENIYIMYG
jgi:hypothetical protein